MGTITVNNWDEFYVADSKMQGLVRWLESHAVRSPMHFMDAAGKHTRPLCGALSAHGTTDQAQVTCTGCQHQLEQTIIKSRLREGKVKKGGVNQDYQIDERPRPPPPQKPQPPPDREIRETAITSVPIPHRVSARRGR